MNNDFPIFSNILFTTTTLVCIFLILIGYYRVQLSFQKEKALKNTILLGIALGFWMGFTGMLAYNGVFRDFSSMPPKVAFAIIPPLIVALLITVGSSINKVLLNTPMHWLIAIQSFRIFVEIFLWQMADAGKAPVQMSFEGLNWDILSGILAIPVAYIVYREIGNYMLAARIYNLIGMALLINIVTIAMMSTPTFMRVFMNDPANTFIAEYPFVWLPAVLVPIAYYMHFFSLKQLSLLKKHAAKMVMANQ
jgi:hypothetical protein